MAMRLTTHNLQLITDHTTAIIAADINNCISHLRIKVLRIAVVSGHAEVVARLSEAGADVHEGDDWVSKIVIITTLSRLEVSWIHFTDYGFDTNIYLLGY